MNPSALTFRSLECIEAVAKLGSIGAAARAIGMSQTVVKQEIEAIESNLGVIFFERRAMALEATSYARLFLDRIDAIRVELAEAEHDLGAHETTENNATIRIAAGIRSSKIWVEPAVERFANLYPTTRLSVDNELLHLYDRLMRREVDLGVSMLGLVPDCSRHIRMEPFGQWRVHFIASPHHPLAKGGPVSLEHLRSYPLAGQYNFPVMLGLLKDDHSLAQRVNLTKGWRVKSPAEDTLESVMRLVENDNCIALLPRQIVKRELAEGRLVALNLGHKTNYFAKFILVYRNEEPVCLALRRFIAHLKVVEAEVALANAEDESSGILR
jgi:DNA-binding transcriptional LysR family regulator